MIASRDNSLSTVRIQSVSDRILVNACSLIEIGEKYNSRTQFDYSPYYDKRMVDDHGVTSPYVHKSLVLYTFKVATLF